MDNRKPMPTFKHIADFRGSALIMAMLVVSLVTTLVVATTWKFELGMARNENRWHGIQARSYLEAAELLAHYALKMDKLQGEKDHLNEIWNQEQQFPTDEGWIAGRVEDAQGRFNINLLQKKVPPPNPNSEEANQIQEIYTVHQKRFIRLLQTLQRDDNNLIDEGYARELTDAVMDWLDPDHETFGYGGAEQDYYESLPIPIPITNNVMTSVSELSVIKGMEPLIYEQLLPLVVALPVDVPININTMPEQLFRMINRKDDYTPLLDIDLEPLLSERNAGITGDDPNQAAQPGELLDGGWDSVQELLQSPTLGALLGQTNDVSLEGFDTKSSYFFVFSETQVGEQRRKGKSMVFRGKDGVLTVRRTDANF